MVMDLIVEFVIYDEESGISVSIIEEILSAQQLAGAEHAEERFEQRLAETPRERRGVGCGDIFLCIQETLSSISILLVLSQALADGGESRGRAELLDIIWSVSRQPLTPEGLAPEEDIHVAPEAGAELRRLRVLVCGMEPVVMLRVASAV